MSVDTIRLYISRLPAQPGPERVLHRAGPERVAGSLGALRVSSAFQPITDRKGTTFAHQAYLRAEGAQGAAAPRSVLESLADDEAVVRFDRMCRTVHALNRFAASEEWTALFVPVDYRLLRAVPEEHGTTFQRILAGFGVLSTRIVLALPAEAARQPGLLEGAIPSYRLRNFRIALDLAGAELLPRVARLRPDYVRVSVGEDLASWATAAREVGARLIVSQIEDDEDRDAAVRAGADLLQGFHIGRPAASVTTSQVAA